MATKKRIVNVTTRKPKKEHKFPKNVSIGPKLESIIEYLKDRVEPFSKISTLEKDKWRDKDPVLKRIKELNKVIDEFLR